MQNFLKLASGSQHCHNNHFRSWDSEYAYERYCIIRRQKLTYQLPLDWDDMVHYELRRLVESVRRGMSKRDGMLQCITYCTGYVHYTTLLIQRCTYKQHFTQSFNSLHCLGLQGFPVSTAL